VQRVPFGHTLRSIASANCSDILPRRDPPNFAGYVAALTPGPRIGEVYHRSPEGAGAGGSCDSVRSGRR
jgi:hypothetical protein